MFKLQARNVKGYGAMSDEISILCASVPFQITAPITTVSSINVVIDWSEPNSGGSPITSYIIEVQRDDG